MLGLSPRLVEQPPLRRRPARWPPGRFGLGRFRIKVGEDLLDDVGIFDARDDPHRPAAGRTGLDVDPENPLEALRPGHRGTAFGRCLVLRIRCRGMPASPAPLGRCHPRAVLAVRRKYPVETGKVHPRFRHQGCQPGNEVQWLEDDVRRAVAVRRLQQKVSGLFRGAVSVRKISLVPCPFPCFAPVRTSQNGRFRSVLRGSWFSPLAADSIRLV